MASLQSQSLLGIGSSSIVLARARVQQCLAAASRSHAPLLQANGGRTGLPSSSILNAGNAISFSRRRRKDLRVVAEAAAAGPTKVTPASSGGVSISDVLWPSAGAFLAMAVLGKMDQVVAFKGVSLTIPPLGAVCCVLFSAPDSPAAKKYNMFVAQIGCAALGVLALSLFGPGWLARGAALSACIAFMTITGASHPPAASLPLLFIDGPKFHSLQLWYALFPGAVGCIVLCLIQEVVVYLKKNIKF
ncbi:HPP [Zea mays]|uniref:HPP n=1 Tax=Zea mays TaxID=4577 RepID=A0A1D6GKC1_MAIZE|nr:HPP [Zea mays]AQK63794.1 HPP [Zea mays]AQK63795.1 HPP [Zea mays]